jgi:cob(I)alamin adenosyltransferase
MLEKPSLKRGLTQVYTGDGKGKTTAALGLALRASGAGLKVVFIQFVKGDADCGEHRFVSAYAPFELFQPNTGNCLRQSDAELKPVAEETYALAAAKLASGIYDVVILDEVLIAVGRGLLTTEAVLELIRQRPPRVELVLTGRGAPPEIITAADLVTEMRAVKHPYDQGITARRGIEF